MSIRFSPALFKYLIRVMVSIFVQQTGVSNELQSHSTQRVRALGFYYIDRLNVDKIWLPEDNITKYSLQVYTSNTTTLTNVVFTFKDDKVFSQVVEYTPDLVTSNDPKEIFENFSGRMSIRGSEYDEQLLLDFKDGKTIISPISSEKNSFRVTAEVCNAFGTIAMQGGEIVSVNIHGFYCHTTESTYGEPMGGYYALTFSDATINYYNGTAGDVGDEWETEEDNSQTPLPLCPPSLTSVGNGWTAEINGLRGVAINNSYNYNIPFKLGVICLTMPKSYFPTSYSASNAFVGFYYQALLQLNAGLAAGTIHPTTGALTNNFRIFLKQNVEAVPGGAFSTGQCSGSVTTQDAYHSASC